MKVRPGDHRHGEAVRHRLLGDHLYYVGSKDRCRRTCDYDPTGPSGNVNLGDEFMDVTLRLCTKQIPTMASANPAQTASDVFARK